jgi:serine/threonine-protein kinase SRPK3
MQPDAISGEKSIKVKEKTEQEAVEVSMGNMAIDGTPKPLKDFQSTKSSE